eukprot:365996-Chlamydomonas_euryale.AAC.3
MTRHQEKISGCREFGACREARREAGTRQQCQPAGSHSFGALARDRSDASKQAVVGREEGREWAGGCSLADASPRGACVADRRQPRDRAGRRWQGRPPRGWRGCHSDHTAGAAPTSPTRNSQRCAQGPDASAPAPPPPDLAHPLQPPRPTDHQQQQQQQQPATA